MFAKRLQWRDGEDEGGVAVDVDDDHAGGGGANRRRFRQHFPPPISAGSGLLTLCLCVFDLRRCCLDETLEGHIYSGF